MKYEVVGPHEVLGHVRGEKFEMDLDAVTEARLVMGGHIARVAQNSYTPRREERDDEHDSPDEA